MESMRSCRCALRNSCRCCTSWYSSIAAAFTGPRPSMRLRTSLHCCSASAMVSGSGTGSSAAPSSSTGQFTEPLDLGRDGVAAVGGLVELLFEPRHGTALAAMPLFESGEFSARGGVLFSDGRSLSFQLLQLLPLGFERRFALRARALLL